MEYLLNKKKAVLASSKTESLEVEVSKMKKDLIACMDESNATKERLKAVIDKLKAEKMLTA